MPQNGEIQLSNDSNAIQSSWKHCTVKLFSQNSNLYDHDTSTLQTDRRTDNLPWQYRAARIASRGKNGFFDHPVGIASVENSYGTLPYQILVIFRQQ